MNDIKFDYEEFMRIYAVEKPSQGAAFKEDFTQKKSKKADASKQSIKQYGSLKRNQS
jgi:hypothetical protein